MYILSVFVFLLFISSYEGDNELEAVDDVFNRYEQLRGPKKPFIDVFNRSFPGESIGIMYLACSEGKFKLVKKLHSHGILFNYNTKNSARFIDSKKENKASEEERSASIVKSLLQKPMKYDNELALSINEINNNNNNNKREDACDQDIMLIKLKNDNNQDEIIQNNLLEGKSEIKDIVKKDDIGKSDSKKVDYPRIEITHNDNKKEVLILKDNNPKLDNANSNNNSNIDRNYILNEIENKDDDYREQNNKEDFLDVSPKIKNRKSILSNFRSPNAYDNCTFKSNFYNNNKHNNEEDNYSNIGILNRHTWKCRTAIMKKSPSEQQFHNTPANNMRYNNRTTLKKRQYISNNPTITRRFNRIYPQDNNNNSKDSAQKKLRKESLHFFPCFETCLEVVCRLNYTQILNYILDSEEYTSEECYRMLKIKNTFIPRTCYAIVYEKLSFMHKAKITIKRFCC